VRKIRRVTKNREAKWNGLFSEPMEALLATVPGLASIHSFTRQELALIEIQLSWDAALYVRLYKLNESYRQI